MILAGYLCIEPERVKFGYTTHGKPFLLNFPAGIQFNLSHSHGFMVAAVCLNSPIGVDIEKKVPIPGDGNRGEVFLRQRERADRQAGCGRPP